MSIEITLEGDPLYFKYIKSLLQQQQRTSVVFVRLGFDMILSVFSEHFLSCLHISQERLFQTQVISFIISLSGNVMRLRFMQLLTLNYVLVLLHQTQVSMNASQDIDPPSLCASVFHSIHPETIFNYSIKSNIHQEGF